MKSTVLKLLMLLLVVAMALGLASCELDLTLPDDDGGNDDGGNDDGGNDDGGNDDGGNAEAPDVAGKITLVSNYKAKFKVVIASGAGSDGRRAAENFVKQLRNLGVDVDDAIEDKSASDVSDIEIIVGCGARNRGDECNISDTFLGAEGYTIKTVGTKIVVAGGSSALMKSAMAEFIAEHLGITDETEEIQHLYVKENINVEILTDYEMDYIKIDGVTLDNYTIVYNGGDQIAFPNYVNGFQQQIYGLTGYWLPVADVTTTTQNDYRIFIRYVTDAGEDGFRAYNSGRDFIIECAYKNVFAATYDEWMEEAILGETRVDFPSDYIWTKHVSTVTYEQFGAVGDGVTDDFAAIFEAHEHANQGNQTVIGTSGKTYYIGASSIGRTITVRSNVDWTGAKFIIDDSILPPYMWTGQNVFTVSTAESVDINDYSVFENLTLTAGQTNIGITFSEDCMLLIKNSDKKMFIRYGGNANDGQDQQEIILVDKNGNVDPSTPIMWDYSKITAVEVIPINSAPLTIKGGEFTTKANVLCNSFPDDGNTWLTGNQYYYYGRGIVIKRSNVTLTGLTHKITGEGSGGYPYSGWISVNRANGVTIEGCTVSGHRTYTENRPGGGGTPMGSYDLGASLSNNVTWKNMQQIGPITSEYYWGIMGSNYCKNLTYDNCRLSRFDAHEGVWNVTIRNSEIGLAINLIGGGTATIEGTTRLARDYFIELRGDYGSLWRGDVILKNCEHKAYKETSANAVCSPNSYYSIIDIFDMGTGWKQHDFGYRCYMPQNITVENFKVGSTVSTIRMFSYSVSSSCVTNSINPLVVTKSVTYKNQSKSISLNSSYLDSVVTVTTK